MAITDKYIQAYKFFAAAFDKLDAIDLDAFSYEDVEKAYNGVVLYSDCWGVLQTAKRKEAEAYLPRLRDVMVKYCAALDVLREAKEQGNDEEERRALNYLENKRDVARVELLDVEDAIEEYATDRADNEDDEEDEE